MYKCKDCGQEYEIKPDYCDCGNNTFDEILPEVIEEKIEVQPKIEQKPIQKPTERNISIFAIVVFVFCIILSVLSIIFIGRGEVKEIIEETQAEIVKDIPNIDSFWNNQPPKIETVTPIKQEPIKIIEQIVTKPVQKVLPKQTPKPVQKTVAKPIQTNVVKQTTQTTQKTTPKQTTPNVDVQKYLTNATNQPVKQQTEQTKPIVQQTATPKVDTVAQKQELANYKLALMKKIASSINFAEVIGDGKCAITFKIDSSGNLVNRNFAIQSSNVSLNDVVYNAMMRTPTYKTPPAGYNKETLTLTVKMYGGNFEVDLK